MVLPTRQIHVLLKLDCKHVIVWIYEQWYPGEKDDFIPKLTLILAKISITLKSFCGTVPRSPPLDLLALILFVLFGAIKALGACIQHGIGALYYIYMFL